MFTYFGQNAYKGLLSRIFVEFDEDEPKRYAPSDYADDVINASQVLNVEVSDAEIHFLSTAAMHIDMEHGADDEVLSLDDIIKNLENEREIGKWSNKNRKEYYSAQTQKKLVEMVKYAAFDQTGNIPMLRNMLARGGIEVDIERVTAYHDVLLELFELTGLHVSVFNAMRDIGYAVRNQDYSGAIERRDHFHKFVIKPLQEEKGLPIIDFDDYCQLLLIAQSKAITDDLTLAEELTDASGRKGYLARAIANSEFNILDKFNNDIKPNYGWVKDRVMDIVKKSSS